MRRSSHAQGWSLVSHAVAKGNATVATIVLESASPGCASLGLISAVPFSITTRVQVCYIRVSLGVGWDLVREMVRVQSEWAKIGRAGFRRLERLNWVATEYQKAEIGLRQ